MIKLRTNVFETNSSSTHTCVLTRYNNYVRWCKGELAWIDRADMMCSGSKNIISLLEKFTDTSKSIIDKDFVDIKFLSDIPLNKVYEESDWLLRNYNKKAEKYTVGDVWKIYETFDYDVLKNYWEEDVAEFKEYYDRAKTNFPNINIDDIQEILNGFNGYSKVAPDPIIYDSWNYFFNHILGIFTIKILSGSDSEQEDITRRTIGDEEVIAYCVYGYD